MWFIVSTLFQNVTYIVNRSRMLRLFTILLSSFTLVYYFRGTDGRTTLDYSVYQGQYYLDSDYFEKGYNIAAHIGRSLNLTYPDFRLLLASVAVFLFIIGVYRLTPNPELAILGYFAGSYLMDIVQIRQFVMLALLVFGISLVKSENRLVKVFGLVSMLMAPEFHSLGWIFVLLFPMSFFSVERQLYSLKIVSVIVGVMTLLFYVLPKSILITITAKIMVLLSSRDDVVQNVTTVYSKGSGIKVILLLVIISIVSLVVAFLMKNGEEETKRNVKLLLFTVYAQLASVILTFMSVDYVRLSRVSVVLIILLLSNLGIHKYRKNMWLFTIVLAMLSIILQMGVVYIKSGMMVPYLLHFIDSDIIR
ncbi:EpsG family protein [Weissella confusa]|uniref:EpsG family protein n=1 Tax=Weissella confusa TaxID=1583 RepID=UPI0018F133B0|nr:EpsG family protein [Weissella confusa]MBJ7670817.1 hypothetical protein [Weissella confusa]